MKIKLDLPADVFDERFPEEAFAARVRDYAVLELLRARRLHEHEAAQILGISRWELMERMEQAGIVPTEKEFDAIRAELSNAIAARRAKSSSQRSRP